MGHLFFFASQVIFLLHLFRLVFGHGFVHSVVIDGQAYPGWNPFVDPYNAPPPRVVRKILNDGYVAANESDLACHHGGDVGTTALAGGGSSGSQVIFQWTYWPGDHQGPVSTYMTSCNGDCSTFFANPARWFKVDADGYDPSNRQWAAAKLIANNYSWVATIPAGLAPGQYLMRNEMYGDLIAPNPWARSKLTNSAILSIALHSSEPQFYPSCLQVRVTGSGTGVPSDSQLISLQTLYQGVTFPDIYSDSVSFTIPGPPPVNFEGSSRSETSSIQALPTTTTKSLQPTTHTLLGPTSTTTPSHRCRMISNKLQRRNSL